MLDLLTYPFFLRALMAAFLVSICCAALGTYIVSRRIVFIAGGISHASFGGIGIGYYLGTSPIAGAAVFAVLSGFVIELISKKAQMRIDSLIGIFWSLGMAVGIFFIYITPGYVPNLNSYLFGSILTVSEFYLILLLVLTMVIFLVFLFFYKIILYVSFDEDYAKTRKLPVTLFNYFLIGMVSLTIVVSIRVVGIILVISLLTIPQVTASLFTHDFKKIIFYSAFIAFIACLSGLMIAHYLQIPSGASIIFCSVMIFIILKTFEILRKRSKIISKLNGS